MQRFDLLDDMKKSRDTVRAFSVSII